MKKLIAILAFALLTVVTLPTESLADGGATSCCCVAGCPGSNCQSLCKP